MTTMGKEWSPLDNQKEITCIFCGETRQTHDQMVCDAIRSVLASRARRGDRLAA